MAAIASISFRDQTVGRINDLLSDEGLACAKSQNILSYLSSALLDYKDEGVEFSPSIVLCGNVQGLLKSFPGAIAHTIGKVRFDVSSTHQVLKDCVPLTNRNWFIFIERGNAETAEYGVFTYFRLPTAIPLQEGITINQSEFVVLIRKIASNTIELRGSKGNTLTVLFSTVREAADNGVSIRKFCDACTGGVGDEKIQVSFKLYFRRLIEEALASSHGTMLVCGRSVDLSAIPEMKDAVIVTPTLDFYAAFADYHTAASAESILGLQRCEELLSGFLRSDGIVVFDTEGRVTAYRVFYKGVAANSPAVEVVGGARRRAFEGVKTLVPNKLISVLFRSQDGLTLHHGSSI